MHLTTAQTVTICLGAAFGLIIIMAIIFAFYATSRARREDQEANAAVLGRWKEVGEVSIRHVPTPVRRANAQATAVPRPTRRESLIASVKLTVPEKAYNPYRHVPPSQTMSVVNNASVNESKQYPATSQGPQNRPPSARAATQSAPGRDRSAERTKPAGPIRGQHTATTHERLTTRKQMKNGETRERSESRESERRNPTRRKYRDAPERSSSRNDYRARERQRERAKKYRR